MALRLAPGCDVRLASPGGSPIAGPQPLGDEGALRPLPARGAKAAPAPKPRRLERALSLLRPLLAALPQEQRRHAIQGFSERLRRRLLVHLQAPTPCRAEPPGMRRAEAPGRHKRRRLAPARAARERPKGRGGVTTVRLGGQERYFARITADGIAISSASTTDRRAAESLRDVLARLCRGEPGTGGAGGSERLLAAFLGLGAPGADVLALSRSTWSFRVLVDARRWVGRVLSTRRTLSIEEALLWRDRLRALRLRGGWRALRPALAELAPQRRLAGPAAELWRTRPQLPPEPRAEAWLGALEGLHSSRRALHVLARRERREARREAQARGIAGRVARLAGRLERLCGRPLP